MNKNPPRFQKYFLICLESKFEVGHLKIVEAQRALSRSVAWSLRGFLEAFPEDFWDASGMVGNIMMSSTQWSHQALQTPSPNP
jgi:hypothetical protein